MECNSVLSHGQAHVKLNGVRLCEWSLQQVVQTRWVPALLVHSNRSAVPLFTEEVWMPNPLLMETQKLAIRTCSNIWNANDSASSVTVQGAGLSVFCRDLAPHNTLVRALFPIRKGVHYWEVCAGSSRFLHKHLM